MIEARACLQSQLIERRLRMSRGRLHRRTQTRQQLAAQGGDGLVGPVKEILATHVAQGVALPDRVTALLGRPGGEERRERIVECAPDRQRDLRERSREDRHQRGGGQVLGGHGWGGILRLGQVGRECGELIAVMP